MTGVAYWNDASTNIVANPRTHTSTTVGSFGITYSTPPAGVTVEYGTHPTKKELQEAWEIFLENLHYPYRVVIERGKERHEFIVRDDSNRWFQLLNIGFKLEDIQQL